MKQSLSKVASNQELLPGVHLMWIDDGQSGPVRNVAL